MASKDLKINIITDASGLATLSKGAVEVGKGLEVAAASVSTLSKRLADAKNLVESFANKSAQAYTDLTNKVDLYNDRIIAGGRAGAAAWGNAQASTAKYNTEVQKAIELQRTLQNAIHLSVSTTSTNRGYTQNASGTVSSNRAAVAEAKEAQLLNQALAQENALRERLAISAKVYLDRINSVEVAKATQQARLLNESLAREAAIRERTTLAARAYLARVAEVNTLVAQTRTRNEQVASSYQDIINRLTMTARAYEATRLATQGFSQAQIQNIQRLQASSNALQDHERHTRNLFLRVGEAIGAYRIWNTLLNGIFNAPVSVTKIGIELEATQSILQSTMGSAAGAAGAMKFLDQEAQRTGITIHTLRTSWRDFSASTTLAGMALNTTAKMFGELNTVITALHLSTDRAQGVFNAMAQIFNKGKVQSEELVKQLGNLLPGAFASFAAATGRTTAELSKAMKKGEVAARELVDFTTYMSDKFAASFGLASQGMNANIGRMQTAFTHLGETFYGLSSGAIVDVVKGITSLTNKMSEAVASTEGYGNNLLKVKSILEGVFIVTLGSALLNVTKLKVALSLLTVPNLLLTGLAAAASYIAYMYNKVQAPLDKLKEAQAQIAESRAQGVFEDKTISIEMRVENAEPIRKAVKELEDLMAAKKDFEQQNEHLAKRTPYSVEHNSVFAEEQARYTRDKTAFEDTIKEKSAMIDKAKVAERIKMEAFAAEDAKRQSAIPATGDNQNLKQIRDRLRDNKLLLDDKLHILDVAGREEERITKEKLSSIENLYAQHKITEQEQLSASNMLYEQSFARRKQLLEEKLAFEQQGKNSLELDGAYKSKLITEDELNILEAYGKAMVENTATINATTVAFEVEAQGKLVNIDLAKTEIEQLQEKAAKAEKLTDTTKRGIAIDRQILDTKEQIKKLESDESIRKDKVATASVQASKNTLDALEHERIKYFELTGEIQKAIEAKSALELKNNIPYQQALKDSESAAPQVATSARMLVKSTGDNVELAKLQDINKAATDYKESLYAIDKATRDLGVTSTEAFDIVNGGMGGLVTAFSNLSNSVNKASDDLNDNAIAQQRIRDKVVLSAQDKEVLSKLEQKQGKLQRASQIAEIDGYRQIAGAASKMFDEKSTAAKAFHAIEVALSAASIGLKLAEMAASLKATAVSIAAGAAKFFEQSGWFGFAGVAGMLAIMASLGVGSAGSNTKAAIPLSTDTGTVLGDSSAKSQSVDNTYKLLQDIQAQNYPVLKSIDRGISDLHSGITDVITRLFQAGGLSTVNTAATSQGSFGAIGNAVQMGAMLGSGGLAKFDPIANKVLGFLFGGKQTSTVTAQGIATNPTAISDVMAGSNLSAQQFANIETKTSGGFFGKDKISTSTQYAALDASTQKALNGVFKSMGTTMLGLADTLGLGLSDRVKNYVIPALNVDLKGLDGEAAAKKLNGVISAALDTMSTVVFGDILGQYQQLGEGMLETAVRIVSEVAVVKDSLDKVGLILKDNAIAVSDAIVQAAGGLKEFQSLVKDYFSNFYSDAERNVFVQEQLNNQLVELNLILPSTREGYRALVSALDINNVADQQRYSLLLKLSGAADEYYTTLESAAKNAQALLNQQRALDIQIMELSGNAIGALTEKRKDELAAMDVSLRFSQQVVWTLTAANTAVSNAVSNVSKAISNLTALVGKLRSALASTTVSSDSLLQQERIAAQGVLNSALATIQSGGSIDKFTGLEQAITSISKPSIQLYSSFEAYAADQAKTGNVIAQLANSAEAQVSDAQRQIDAVNGTTSAVLSVKDAIAELATALGIKAATLKAIDTANLAVKAEATAKTTSEAAAAQAAQSQQNVANAIAAANTAAQAASTAQATANTPTAPAPTTFQNGQSGNPIWEQVLSGFNAAHQARFGIPMNRAWTADADAQNQYQQLVAQYNANSAAASAAAQASAAGLLEVANAAAALIPGYQATAQVDQVAASNAAAAYATASAYANAAKAAVPGINSFAIGTNFIESDRWAQVHRGERILPAADNRQLMQRLSTDKDATVSQELISELKELRKTVAEQQKTLNEIAKSSKETAAILDNTTGGGGPMLTQAV